MPRTKKFVCICKPTPVLTDNDDSGSDTVNNLATTEQTESEEVLSKETVEKTRSMPRKSCLLKQKTH